MVGCKLEEILELIDSVMTASVLNDQPEEALDNLALYYQVDRQVLEHILLDVYYNFIIEKTDFKGEAICIDKIDAETFLKVLIYLVVLKDSTVEQLVSSLNLGREELEAVYRVVCENTHLTGMVIKYIECTTHVLLGRKN